MTHPRSYINTQILKQKIKAFDKDMPYADMVKKIYEMHISSGPFNIEKFSLDIESLHHIKIGEYEMENGIGVSDGPDLDSERIEVSHCVGFIREDGYYDIYMRKHEDE
jgi:hypothetical protein